MSCLTRKLQQKLTRYLKKRGDVDNNTSVDTIKHELVGLGICPSHITDDQMREIIRGVDNP